jgi:hypothetical protein
MSTFYVLPPRPLVRQCLAGCLEALLPGLDCHRHLSESLAEALEASVAAQPEVYLVYREELPDGEDLGRALTDGFGAETGDTVVEVRSGSADGAAPPRVWHLAGPS